MLATIQFDSVPVAKDPKLADFDDDLHEMTTMTTFKGHIFKLYIRELTIMGMITQQLIPVFHGFN